MDGEPRNAASAAYRGDGAMPVQRSRSLRRLLSGKHGAPAPLTSSPTSMYPPTPNFPAAPRPQLRPQQLSNTQRQRDLEQDSRTQRSASNDSYHSNPNPFSYTKNKRPMPPSEAARLRSLNTGQQSPSYPESPLYNQEMAPPRENFSRPRQASMKKAGDPPRTAPSSGSTMPQQSRGGTPANRPEFGRDRGFSESPASMSTAPVSSRSLRNAYSIPELSAAERQLNGPGNLANSRNGLRFRGNSPNPDLRPNFPGASNDEEVRESLRSIQTTGTGTTSATWDTPTSSVFLDTARSSVMSKASSARSVNGRDQIDDFLDMYEGGFDESEAEAENEHRQNRPATGRSIQSETGNQTTIPELDGMDLVVPKLQHTIIRDSTDMFRTPGAYVDPFNVDVQHGNGSNQDQPTLGISRQPSGRGVIGAQFSRFDSTRDHYGFKKKSLYVPLEVYEAWSRQYVVYLARRRKKWADIMKSNGLGTEDPTRFPPKSHKIKRCVRKGIPPDWRGEAWFFYAGGHEILAKHPGVYDDLVRRSANGDLSPTDEEIIERDLHRTFPDNIMFKPDDHVIPSVLLTGPNAMTPEPAVDAETPILKSLRRVLQATAIYNPKIGYCQSLNFLAGLLLLFMCEERAFWMLDLITKTHLPGTHELTLEGANVDLGVLMVCLSESMPAVWAKIGGELDGNPPQERRNVPYALPPITLCCTAWFMSCFIGTLPIETTLRVWDSFFFEGSKTLFRIALAVFKVGEAEIRAINDSMEVFQVVQTIPRRLIDANALMNTCYRRRNGFGHLTQDNIDEMRASRRQGYADHRAKNGENQPEQPEQPVRSEPPSRPSSKKSNLSKKSKMSLFATMRGKK
ncbi:hypothetical protein V502_08368 [Pseudogymnoascus sp. VKM F-4520 (FW-2644)]|nr:hypothetical protein V502_08368 [Pseudogymnoascus sp. VKM F-4520 (FW-2644)]